MIHTDFNTPPKKDEIIYPIFHVYRYYIIIQKGFQSPRQIKRGETSGWWVEAYDAFKFKTKNGQWVSK